MYADEELTKRYIGDAVFINKAPARTLLEFLRYSPGRYFIRISTPVFVAVCRDDMLAPAKKTIKLSSRCESAICRSYGCGHFEIYLSPFFEETMDDYISFFDRIVNQS